MEGPPAPPDPSQPESSAAAAARDQSEVTILLQSGCIAHDQGTLQRHTLVFAVMLSIAEYFPDYDWAMGHWLSYCAQLHD